MKLKKLSSIAMSAIFALAGLLCINPQIALAAGPFTCTWTGGGGDSNFSTAGNWSGCNSAAPQVGDHDNLVFPAGPSVKTPNNNLTTGTSFSSLSFTGTNYTLTGNAMDVNGSITDSSGGSTNLIQTSFVRADATTTVTGPSGSHLTINTLDIGSSSAVTISNVAVQHLNGGFSDSVLNIGTGVIIYSTDNAGLTTININSNFSTNGSLTTYDSINVPDGVTFTNSVGDTVTSDVSVASGATFVIDGTVDGDITVSSGGLAQGSGTVGTVSVQQGGVLAPGHSPGCITAATATISGTYQEEIAGASTACTDYDQLIATSQANVTNGTLDIRLTNGFTPAKGQAFTIINNQGVSPIVGTFSGLGEGATVSSGGYDFKISYVGGDGNDVVLTTVGPTAVSPGTPNTGIGLIAAHPFVTLATTTIAALTILIIARRLRPATD